MVKAGRRGGQRAGRAAFFVLAALLALGWTAGQALAGEASAIVFLGDSITHQGDWARLLGRDDVDNQGLDGDTSAGVLHRLPAVIAKRPAKIFLMIGINDLRRGGGKPEAGEQLLANHERILGRLRADLPRAQVHVLSILPVSRRFFGFMPDNRGINEVNRRLQALAQEKGCAWLDLHPLFADQEGALDKRLTYDGLHLNAEGYQVWKKAIAPLL
jgi:lysophospholipase L1-like esterase